MINLESVTAGYGGNPVLRGLTLRFEKGGITGILGPNGCGKSTLLKVVSGLLKPTSGQVCLGGKPLLSYSPKELAKEVAVLPQSREIPAIPVEALVSHGRFPYLGFPRKLAPTDHSTVESAMERAGVLEHRHKLLSALSGGERQKVYLAMVLAQDTPIVLMDEPTTYLDINHQFELLRLVRELADSGKTVLVVMHDLAQALETCDRILLLDHGEAIAYGPAGEVADSRAIDRVFGVVSQRVEDLKGRGHYLFSEQA